MFYEQKKAFLLQNDNFTDFNIHFIISRCISFHQIVLKSYKSFFLSYIMHQPLQLSFVHLKGQFSIKFQLFKWCFCQSNVLLLSQQWTDDHWSKIQVFKSIPRTNCQNKRTFNTCSPSPLLRDSCYFNLIY